MTELKNYILKPLTFIGAINYALIGLFGFDLISEIFRNVTVIRIVDIVIGLAAAAWLVLMFMHKGKK